MEKFQQGNSNKSALMSFLIFEQSLNETVLVLLQLQLSYARWLMITGV